MLRLRQAARIAIDAHVPITLKPDEIYLVLKVVDDLMIELSATKRELWKIEHGVTRES